MTDKFNNNLKTIEIRRYANIVDQIKDYPILLRHQNNVCKYLDTYHSILRGFMITHEMGTGKTITAVFALSVLKNHYPDRKLLVIAPKSLHSNFNETIKRFEEYINYKAEEVEYVSSNASNFFDQLMVSHTSKAFKDLYKKGKNDLYDEKIFDNKICIIDEAHNFFSNIANAKHIIKRSDSQMSDYSQAERIYNLILSADNPKIIYMSGTPISNTVFEFAIAANMFKGWNGNGQNRTTIFPEEHSRFNEYFINENGIGMKNTKEFQSRIFGCCSFYGKDYYSKETKELFPSFTRHVEYIEMGELQFKKYVSKAVELENLRMERKGEYKLEVERWEHERDQKYADAQFRVSLRQISNIFTPPGYDINTYKKLDKNDKQEIDNYFLEDIRSYSPKIYELVNKLENSPKQKTVIYSHFTTTIEFIKVYLNYKSINFGTVTGEDSHEKRSDSVNKFNDPNSGYDLMIISSAGAEGLDLKGVRSVHILEPQYNMNRIEQIETRGVRFKSHVHLPENERHVDIYLYICIFGKDYNKEVFKDVVSDTQLEYILGRPSVDVDLYQKSIQKKKTYSDLISCIKRSSIDCYNYRKEGDCINAKMINKPLYELNIPYDISINGYDNVDNVNESKSMLRLYAPDGFSFVYKISTDNKGNTNYEPMAKFTGTILEKITGAIINEAKYHLSRYQKNSDGYTTLFYEQEEPLVVNQDDLFNNDEIWGGNAEDDERMVDDESMWADSSLDW